MIDVAGCVIAMHRARRSRCMCRLRPRATTSDLRRTPSRGAHRAWPKSKIKAETRTEFGKGAARRIRRDDKVPAVLYGHGNDPMHITLPGHDTMMALKHGGSNALLYIDIEGRRTWR